MTEDEWLACVDPAPMLEFLRYQTSERKLRLFAVACCRRIWHRLEEGNRKEIVEISERYADALATDHELSTARADAEEFLYETNEFTFPDLALSCVTEVSLVANAPGSGEYLPVSAAECCASAYAERSTDLDKVKWYDYDESSARREVEQVLQCRMVCDIFGNPFLPVTLPPEWRTEMARALAAQMYESRDFSAMPILADALQDAGCENTDILNHCRDSTTPHVRGCWVVDLLLGKC